MKANGSKLVYVLMYFVLSLLNILYVANLNIENLNEVYNLTLPYCAKWESIGRELGIPKGSLDATRMNRINSGGVEGCLQEMLAKWLRDSKPKPTWLALNRALESVSGT